MSHEEFCLIESPIKVGSLVRSHSVVYGKCQIGEDFTTGHHVLIRDDCIIGNNVSIGSFSDIEDSVVIGDNVQIHSRVFIPRHTVIKEGAWIGPNVTFTNDKYPGPSEWRKEKKREGVIVCESVTIGAGSVILPSVTIGKGAIVGAGAVVTKDVPARAVVVGNPAKIVRWVQHYNEAS